MFEPRSSAKNAPALIDDHDISEHDFSRNALRVVKQLQDAGYAAYLVGGCVRDLLLEGQPKDFDVATSATPEQVRGIFRSARIIGRRFRIVHVRFGREIIEVTTFRANHEQAQKRSQASQSEKGVLLRDNVYGDIRSDAYRRDFTVNALYYDPQKAEILDYTDALSDIEKRQLRIIGDPELRYKEDPVRMLRAVRFSAKLGFAIEPKSEQPIYEHAEYLAEIPSARLFEEALKLFLSGYATAILNKLEDFKLLDQLFPGAAERLANGSDYDRRFIESVAANTDKRIRQNKSVSPAYIYAALMWPSLRDTISRLQEEQQLNEHDAMQMAAQGVIAQQLTRTAIPKRFLIPLREIWFLQQRMIKRDGKKAPSLMENPRFRAAYDFILMREDAGEDLEGIGLWWTKYQKADDKTQQDMASNLNQKGGGKNSGKRNSRRPRRRGPGKSSSKNQGTE